MKHLDAHLVRTEDIVSSWSESPFKGITEAEIQEEANTIKNVCVFGTRYSKNGYVYQDKAIDSLVSKADGAKFFINHPSKNEQKDRDGVRDIRDWAGIFSSPKREGDKVFADLTVRPVYWGLIKDVAVLQPEGVGNSINSRVKVYKDQDGKESILDIDILKSIDLVASAATTTYLFENFKEINEEDEERDEEILFDKLKEKEIQRQISRLQWNTEEIISKILMDENKEIKDKKKEIADILDDLESEINEIMAGKKIKITIEGKNQDTEGEKDMKELTIEQLKKERPDLIKSILAEAQDEEVTTKMKKDLESLQAKMAEMEKSHEELQKANESLTKERDELKTKLDEYETLANKAKKEAMIAEKIKASELPDYANTETFRENLMKMEKDEDIDKAIEDRKELCKQGEKKDPVSEEFDPTDPETKEKIEAVKEEFFAKIKE